VLQRTTVDALVCHDHGVTTRGVGRPRHSEIQRTGANSREQILDAAAELFTLHGYQATSTRQVAEAVGVKQASIYYHFHTKQEILGALLERTVRPSLQFSRLLTRSAEAAHVQLYALIRFDVTLLSSGPWNIGVLYTLPEVRAEEFAGFRRERASLRRAYLRRITAAASQGVLTAADPKISTSIVFALAESVISMRSDSTALHPDLPDLIAASAMRLLGADARRINDAAIRANDLWHRTKAGANTERSAG
jgi:AcrR family transcriptional regulator